MGKECAGGAVSLIAWLGVEIGPNCGENGSGHGTQCGSVGMRATSSVFVGIGCSSC
jgi:hypothetical protein